MEEAIYRTGGHPSQRVTSIIEEDMYRRGGNFIVEEDIYRREGHLSLKKTSIVEEDIYCRRRHLSFGDLVSLSLVEIFPWLPPDEFVS